MSSTTTYPNYSPGLEGVIAGISKISEIDSEHSSLQYRGYNVHELAEQGSYEETAYLLLFEKLPDRAELAAFKKTLGEEREPPQQVYDALALAPKGTHPMELIRIGYSVLAAHDPEVAANDHETNLRKAVRIVAKAGAVVAAAHRIQHGEKPMQADPSMGLAESFLYLLQGKRPDEYTTKVMDASFTLYAEHGFNASTFACRVCVSTLSDLYSGVISGMSTLKGPLHGGANEKAMQMILEIGTPENADKWIHAALAEKRLVMGFGHREYKHGDSRAFYMTRVAKDIGKRMGNTKYGEIADVLEKVMLEEKGLHPNVDFPTGYAYYLLGLPIPLYTPIFVISRLAGYCAHGIEQLDHNRLIRPKCIYEGPSNLKYVPLADR